MMTVNTTTHPGPTLRCKEAEPGEGYRLLDPEEIIEKTDEVWNKHHERWQLEYCKVGRPLYRHWRPRRRKVRVAHFEVTDWVLRKISGGDTDLLEQVCSDFRYYLLAKSKEKP